MGNRTKAELLPELEAKIVEYMQADTGLENLMLAGFVLKAQAIDMMDASPGAMGTTIWLAPDNQSVFMSIGLADALAQDVSAYYDGLYEGVDIEDDPEDGV